MRNWGWILVLGDSGASTSTITTYLQKARLAFVNKSIDQRIQDLHTYPMAFVCGSSRNELSMTRQLQELKNQQIPAVVIASDHSQFFANQCEENAWGPLISLPLDDLAVRDALNSAMYRKDAAHLRANMPVYARKLSQLTDRERLIVQMAADGATNKRIARYVGLAEKTVERIRQKLRKKLNVNSVAEMTQVVTLGMVFEFNEAAKSVKPPVSGSVPAPNMNLSPTLNPPTPMMPPMTDTMG